MKVFAYDDGGPIPEGVSGYIEIALALLRRGLNEMQDRDASDRAFGYVGVSLLQLAAATHVAMGGNRAGFERSAREMHDAVGAAVAIQNDPDTN